VGFKVICPICCTVPVDSLTFYADIYQKNTERKLGYWHIYTVVYSYCFRSGNATPKGIGYILVRFLFLWRTPDLYSSVFKGTVSTVLNCLKMEALLGNVAPDIKK
jgi:hypothetical protein